LISPSKSSKKAKHSQRKNISCIIS